ncbi:hypothetical protein PI124_g16403 [Phytophthora idaei]|nr:hypothetical protein PI124_g16403 [Phytophthora idaei]
MEQIRDQQRQRQTYTRMLQSKESCYDRMHAALTTRNQKLWNASARTIVGSAMDESKATSEGNRNAKASYSTTAHLVRMAALRARGGSET